MTDNEIIKALECCCEAELKVDCQKLKCPFFDNEIYNCMNVDNENAMYRYSLDLINRKCAENEALIAGQETMSKCIEEQQAEIERLTKETMNMAITIETCQAEAIKEFAERVKKSTTRAIVGGDILTIIDKHLIDNLVKEMAGDTE